MTIKTCIGCFRILKVTTIRPLQPSPGQFYYDLTEQKFLFWTAEGWVHIGITCPNCGSHIL